MRSNRIVYTVEPLRPVVDTRRHSELTGELTIEKQRFDFWEFLNLPFMIQIQTLAFMLLKWRGLIKNQYRNWQETSIEFKQFDADSISKTIEGHIDAYINFFGVCPVAILVGQDIHEQLFCDPLIQYLMQYSFARNNQMSVCGIDVILVRHMRGFVLLPDITKENRS